MTEILDKIIGTYKGTNTTEENKDFWTHIFKYYYGAGSGVNPSIDGWIINFIPYIDDKRSAFAQRDLETMKKQYKEGDKDGEPGEDDDEEDWFVEVDLT